MKVLMIKAVRRRHDVSNVRLLDAACGVSSRDCLLYTSPSPRDRTRSRMPSSA